MNAQKTFKGVSLYARTQSLGNAQRVHATKSYETHRQPEEFIGPMWMNPELWRKAKEQELTEK